MQYLTKQFPKWTAIDKALETGGPLPSAALPLIVGSGPGPAAGPSAPPRLPRIL